MADPWKALDGDDSAATGPRRQEQFTAPSALAERSPGDGGEVARLNGSPTPTPGRAGHRALAALAAEVAQAAEGDEAGGDEAGAGREAPAQGDSVATSPVPGDGPHVDANGRAAGTDDPPAGFPVARSFSRLPLPGGLAGLRLDKTAAPAELATIPLRKRVIADLPPAVPPAGVAPAPAPAPVEPTGEDTKLARPSTTGYDVALIEAWSPREDDILPGRQVRRGGSFWRLRRR